jgi:hypothetical protein
MSSRIPALLIVLSVFASPLFAGYSGRDLFIPAVGRGTGHDGRIFATTLWLTNVSHRDAAVTLTFLTTTGGIPHQHVSHLALGPSETKLFEELGAETLGAAEANGALHVQSDRKLLANARLSSRMANEPGARGVGMSCAGIPSDFALGTGDTATMQGVAAGDYRTKLYVTETTGRPLGFAIALLDTRGREVRRRLEYVAGFEHRIVDIPSLFPGAELPRGIVRLTGVNGNGRIIAGAAQITTGTVDGTFFEMSMETKPRWRMPRAELGVYGLVALAIVFAAVAARRRKSAEQ